MKIPPKIKINNIWWTIKEVLGSEIDSDDVVCGDQSAITQTIRINKDMSPEMKEVTLIHEIIHCIDGELDHNLVEMISSCLHQVITENNLFRE